MYVTASSSLFRKLFVLTEKLAEDTRIDNIQQLRETTLLTTKRIQIFLSILHRETFLTGFDSVFHVLLNVIIFILRVG